MEAKADRPPGMNPGESEKQYQIRAIRMKLGGELDMDWSELASWLRMGCSGEHLRRIAYGVRLMDEAMEGTEADDGQNSALPKPSGVHTSIPVSNPGVQEMRDLRNETAQIYRETDRDRALREQVRDSIRTLPPVRVKPVPAKHRKGGTLIVPIADPHYGRECTIYGLNGEILNDYNPDVFEARMDRLLGDVLDDLERSGADRLLIPLLGDSIDGMLRMNQLTTLRYGMVDSCIRFSEYMVQWVAALTEMAGVPVTVVNLCGNHDEIRPLNSKRGDFAKENLGRIVGWYLSARLGNQENLKIVEADDKHLMNVEGFGVLFIHGEDEGKSQSASRDYGFLYNRRIDYTVRGHLHKYGVETVGMASSGTSAEEIYCPSICGIDDYAVSLKKSAPAGAIAFLIQPGKGKVETYQHVLGGEREGWSNRGERVG